MDLNKEKLTNIIIFIFVLLSLTYLYTMNSNTTNTTTNNKSLSEKFMILTEEQNLEANEVIINNMNQVSFKGAGDNTTINFQDPNATWPATLLQILNTKLDNNGILGNPAPPAGYFPLQGIEFRNPALTLLVKIGDNIPVSGPTSATKINDKSIQFGGPNSGREANSAQISVGTWEANSLCIVGMSIGTASDTRKIKMWAEGGLTVNGPTKIENGTLNVTGATTLRSSLAVTGATTLSSTLDVGGDLGIHSTIRKTRGNAQNCHLVSDMSLYLMAKNNVVIYKCINDCSTWDDSSGNLVVQNNLTVDGTTTLNGKFNYNGDLDFLPSGCIIMWHNGAIPPGWTQINWFDNRFPMGGGSTGRTGGTTVMNHNFKLSEPQMPAHSHAVTRSAMGADEGAGSNDLDLKSSRGWNIKNHTSWVGGAGQGANININWDNGFQPYCTVIFIRRN